MHWRSRRRPPSRPPQRLLPQSRRQRLRRQSRPSFSTAPTVYDDKVCNDANAGANGPWVTAFNNGETQRCRTSTQIWDMSGNVAEWTGSCITVLNKQYCRVRGGSYLSQGPATACNFTFVLDVPDFVNSDLGFRCCSDVAP